MPPIYFYTKHQVIRKGSREDRTDNNVGTLK